jgi:hypothetical protein
MAHAEHFQLGHAEDVAGVGADVDEVSPFVGDNDGIRNVLQRQAVQPFGTLRIRQGLLQGLLFGFQFAYALLQLR